MMVRCVARECMWLKHRSDFSPGTTRSAGRVIAFTALKLGLETFDADDVDVGYQAPTQENVVVESIWNERPEIQKTRTLCGV